MKDLHRKVELRSGWIEEIRRTREEVLARRGGKPLPIDVAALIEQIRSERDEEILAAILSTDR